MHAKIFNHSLNNILDRKTIIKVTSTLFILCSIGIGTVDLYIQNTTTPYGIISFEFISTLSNSNNAMAAWGYTGQSAAGISLGLDFLYIFLYSILTCTLLLATSDKVLPFSKKGASFLKIAAYFFPLAGLADAVENLCLIQLLLGSQNNILPQIAYLSASIKFFGVVICVVFIAAGQLYGFSKNKDG